MSKQLDLIGANPFQISQAGGITAPRLWVRRLKIWQEPDNEPIRDIKLRPGLNIIWSPDGTNDASGEQNSAIGHGSGKTLFCRLIRYCLGEKHYASESLRNLIVEAFPNGIVGAEVILDDVCWAIARPIGNGTRHMAIQNGTLDEIVKGKGTPTGLDPFINAIDENIFSREINAIIRRNTERPTWPVALSWLARDQECRFNDVAAWRSQMSASGSPSPASGRKKGPRVDALRAFLKLITAEEKHMQSKIAELKLERRRLQEETGHRRWAIDRSLERLVSELDLLDQNLPDQPMLFELLRKTATERVKQVAELPDGSDPDLVPAKERYKSAQNKWVQIERECSRLDVSLPLEELILSQIRGELPNLSYLTVESESQICPICGVPIDLALAKKCGVSDKLHDPDECRARWEQRKHDARKQELKIEKLRHDKKIAFAERAKIKHDMDNCASLVASIEKARDERQTAWRIACNRQDEIERLVDQANTQEMNESKIRELKRDIEKYEDQFQAFRNRQSRALWQMIEKFDNIVKILIGQNAKANIKISGTGLKLLIDVEGDRETVAFDLLKVLAFDIAALCLSIEGASHIPAFFIHDSPREADLSLNIYNKLFNFIKEIEACTPKPLFQYIITTTTPPPPEYAIEPWLCLTLRDSPGSERLLRCDLKEQS